MADEGDDGGTGIGTRAERDDGGTTGGPRIDEAGRVGGGAGSEPAPDRGGREFGWRGWVLVAWLFVAIVAVPAYLYFYPRAGESLALFGLGYRGTFLVLPLVPAILLGLLAVWATTRP